MLQTKQICDRLTTKDEAVAEDQAWREDFRLVKKALTNKPSGTGVELHQVEGIRSAIEANRIEFDPAEIDELTELFAAGAAFKGPMPTLASSQNMRCTQRNFCHTLEPLVEAAGGCERWKAATVTKSTFHLSPAELLDTPAKHFMDILRTDARRVGVSNIDAPLIGAIHCEFDPNRLRFVMRAHLVGPTQKIDALQKLRGLSGYITESCGAPVRTFSLGDAAELADHVFGGFLPERPIIDINNERAHPRPRRGSDALFHVLQVVWLHRQTLMNVMLLQDVWSSRGGISKEGRDLLSEIRWTSRAQVASLNRLRRILGRSGRSK